MKMYGLRLILVVLVGFVVLTSYGWVCCSSVTVSHPSASFNHPQQTCTHSIGNQKLKPITKHTYLAASLSNGATVCSHNDATFLASNFIGRSSNADLVRRIRTSLGQICSSYIPPLLIGSSAAIAVKKSRQIINLLVSEWLPRYPVQMPVLAGLVLSAMTFFVDNDLSKSTLPFSTLLTKQVVKRSLLRWLAMIITIGGGCSLGVAAPAVEIGMFMAFLATINVTSYVPFINSGSEEHFILILAGAAAGFAANFNAPLSGILFASEVTSRLLPKPKDQQSTPLNILQPKVLSKVVCAVIAAVLIVRNGNMFASIGPLHTINVATSSPQSILLFASLGIVSNLIFRTYLKSKELMRFVLSFFHPALGPVLGGLLCAVLAHFKLPQTIPWSFATMNQLSTKGLTNLNMLKYLIVKLLATSLCLESGQVGGVVAPMLFLGSMGGGLYFQLVNRYLPFLAQGTSMGAMSLVGSAAALSCHFKSLLMPMLLIAEISHSWNLMLPLLMANLVAVATS